MPPTKRKPSLKERRRRKRFVIFFLSAVVVVSFFVLAVIGLRMPDVNISSVVVHGAKYAREDLVQQFASSMLEGSYFFLIPRSSIFVYPKTAMARDALSLFPSVKEISITRNGFTALSISLTERTPAALWCASFASTSPCYVMDDGGFVFAKADSEQSADLLAYLGNLSGDPLAATFLHGDYEPLDTFVGDIGHATERDLFAVSIDENDDVTVFFKSGGELRFARKDMSDVLLESIASVFASDRFHSDDTLEYADFRFGNKIYVKFEGE